MFIDHILKTLYRIIQVCLLKLRTVKQEGLRTKEGTRESLGTAALTHGEIEVTATEVRQGRAAVSSLRSQRKGALGDRVSLG